jgi:GNAT superfamily N-acetyltransferase
MRETTAADADALLRLLNAAHPARVGTKRGFLHRLRSVPAEARRRSWVAEEGSEILGVATVGLNYESTVRSWFAAVTVAPEQRGRGVGGALADVALEHAGAGERIVCEVENAPAARHFVQSRGFRQTFVRRYSAVDPRTVQVVPLPEGYSLAPFTELDPKDVFEDDIATAADVPLDEPMDAIQLDQWLLDYWTHPDMDLAASVAVCSEGRPVSITYLRRDPATARALNDYTATLPAFRGRGLARIVKAAALRAAAERDTTVVYTQNDETNAAMLAVNERLGYRPHSRSYSYVRDASAG